MNKVNFYFDEGWMLSSGTEYKKSIKTMREIGSLRRETVKSYQPENIEPQKTPHVFLLGDAKK